MMLSPEEQKTIEGYGVLYRERMTSGYFVSDFWRPEFERFQELLPSGKVIDLGCGIGNDAHFFLDAKYDYVGVDLSQTSIAIAQERYREGDFQVMDMYELAFPSETFDGFWAVASLLHAPSSRLPLLLSEVRRVMKDGASGLIVMQEGNGEQWVKDRFFNFTSLDGFREVLEKEGFLVEEAYKDPEDSERKKPSSGTNWLIYHVRVKK